MGFSTTEYNERYGRYPGADKRFGKAKAVAPTTSTKGQPFHVGYDMSGAEAALDALLEASHKAIRPAAQAGAEELYLEARLRCPVSEDGHYFHGTQFRKTGVKYFFEPGSLQRAVYHAFSEDNSVKAPVGYSKATYHIAWNHQKVPYGFMVEFGTSRAPAHPFLAPAFDARVAHALRSSKSVYRAELKSNVPGLQ